MFLVSYIALWILVLSLLIGVFLLYQYLGEQMQRIQRKPDQGPALGQNLSMTLATVDDRHVSLGDGQVDVLVFAAPGCGACDAMKRSIREAFAARGPITRRVTFIYRGDPEQATLCANVVETPS